MVMMVVISNDNKLEEGVVMVMFTDEEEGMSR